MCGIAGIVLPGRATVDVGLLRAMTDTIVHRGPDGEGHWTAPGVGLGHRRLSILDLSSLAAQPMVHPDQTTALTFNGEIYNFAVLRKALQAQGIRPRSTGDTEVVLHLLRRYGPGAFAQMHGFFALGYWDDTARTLLLARDRFGKKPLYYAPLGDAGREGIVFASELRALLAHPRVRAERELDPVALAQYLVHEFVPAPRSILRGVKKLLPGEVLTWNDGGPLRLERFYTPPFAQRARGLSEADAISGFTAVVEEATRLRLVADVPVGVFLSGGLDSSLIAACAVKVHPQVRTFSIGFEDPSFDESSYARRVAQHLGTTHTEERLTAASLLDVVPSTLDWLDEPFADSSLLPTTLLARLARRDVTVALGGDGGDEILAGYPTFMLERAMGEFPALPSALGQGLRALTRVLPTSGGNFSLGFKARQFAQGLAGAGALRHARWLAPLVPEDLEALAGPRLDAAARARSFDAASESATELWRSFDAATAFYLRVYLGEGVLTKVDRATMRASLEARAPLLDTAVVEFCLALPERYRIRGSTTKWLMREALRGKLPEDILARPKKGFGAPVGQWLRGPLEPMLRDTLRADRLREAGLFRPETVARWIDAHCSGREDLRKPLWSLLVFERWRQRWLA